MEFTVNKADLVRELSLSQGVVEKKTTIPILSNVLIETAGDRIHLTATDLELSIRCSCPATVRSEGAGTIPAKRLLDYVRLLPDAAINIKVADNHWATLVCGRSRTRLAGMSRESFPELPTPPESVATLPLRLLSRLISRTIFAISVEESRFTLNGALMLVRPDSVVMVSTDGHRLSLSQEQVDFGEAQPEYRALVARKAMSELLKLSQEGDEEATLDFGGDENHLFFRAGDRLLISRKLTGNFPDFERVLPAEQPHRIVLARDEFRSTMERVAQFSDERSHAVRLRFQPGELKLHSSLSDTGDTEEVLPITYEGPAVEVGFNALYIGEFLRAVGDSEVSLGFRDANSAGELRPVTDNAGSTYRYVVMPMRI